MPRSPLRGLRADLASKLRCRARRRSLARLQAIVRFSKQYKRSHGSRPEADRGQSEPRQKIRGFEPPGVRRRTTGQQHPNIVLESHVHDVKKRGLGFDSAIGVFKHHSVRLGACFDALFVQRLASERNSPGHSCPNRCKVAFSSAFRSDNRQHSTRPVRPELNCAERLPIGGRGEKILSREAWRMGPAK